MARLFGLGKLDFPKFTVKPSSRRTVVKQKPIFHPRLDRANGICTGKESHRVLSLGPCITRKRQLQGSVIGLSTMLVSPVSIPFYRDVQPSRLEIVFSTR